MTKKATMSKTRTARPQTTSRGRLNKRPVAIAASSHEATLSNRVSVEVGSSDEQVLHTLMSNITEKLGDQGVAKAQMHEFLNLILDTDPALKEEILRGIRDSK
jgi:hypothetical protein